MMYALIYTFFLGFGLQIGNDLYLVINQSARRDLDQLAARVYTELSVVGGFVPDNGTFSFVNGGKPLNGTFTFSDLADPLRREHIVVGCFRQPDQPWYLQVFPWWTQFIIVPIFSLLSSLMNLQPIWTSDMLVMIIISCASYTTNKVANHFIPNRSDFVSFIGAFSVGILGNIYSRRMNGTAFTVMVTGVLFLVPVSPQNLPHVKDLRNLAVWLICRRGDYSTGKRHRYRRCNDCSRHWHHLRSLRQSSYRLRLRHTQERRSILLLSASYVCVFCNRFQRNLVASELGRCELANEGARICISRAEFIPRGSHCQSSV